jgi:hypothetical protein
LKATSFLEAFCLQPKMTYKEKISDYKLMIVDLFSYNKKKLIYNAIALTTLLIYSFTDNFLVFTNMVSVLVQWVKEENILKAAAKTLAMLLRKKVSSFLKNY